MNKPLLNIQLLSNKLMYKKFIHKQNLKNIIYKSGTAFIWIIILAGCFIMILPFFWMFSTSVMETRQIMQYPPRLIPSPPTWKHFKEVFETVPFVTYYKNSIIIAVISISLSIFFGLLAGYSFSIYEFPLRNFFFILILSTIMVPFQITCVSLYILLSKMGVTNTYFGILAPNMASALGVFLIKQGIQQVPRSLIEAARIDGAGEFRIILQLIAPNIKTTIFTVGLILFINSWNDFLWPMIIIDSAELRTIPIGLSLYKDPYGTIAFGPLMAATVIAVFPMLIIYAFTQKHIIRGLTLSGIKS